MAQIGDADRGDVTLLARDRDGHEPAAALLEARAGVALGALHRGLRERPVGRRRDGQELKCAHDFSLTPSGSKNGPTWTRMGTGLPSMTTSKALPSTASPTGMIARPITFPSSALRRTLVTRPEDLPPTTI